jgi:hypothetical protein
MPTAKANDYMVAIRCDPDEFNHTMLDQVDGICWSVLKKYGGMCRIGLHETSVIRTVLRVAEKGF